MKAKTLVFGGLAAGGAAILLRRRMASDGATGGRSAGSRADRWHTVTVNRPQEEISPEGRLPGPLAELGDAIEVQMRPAPGDRGTEIAAQARGPVASGPGAAAARIAGKDPRQWVREALRKSRSLVETGEVLSPDRPPTTKPTPGGKLLGLVTTRARGEGLL